MVDYWDRLFSSKVIVCLYLDGRAIVRLRWVSICVDLTYPDWHNWRICFCSLANVHSVVNRGHQIQGSRLELPIKTNSLSWVVVRLR